MLTLHSDTIYIPLCFYFIVPTWDVPTWADHIYIPLCFYFIRVYYGFKSINYSNLHSTMLLLYLSVRKIPCFLLIIYIPLCFYFISTLFLLVNVFVQFTFHYASTLSALSSMAIICSRVNLHSTMLLLYLSCGLIKIQSQSIYIPLCFYFIQRRI